MDLLSKAETRISPSPYIFEIIPATQEALLLGVASIKTWNPEYILLNKVRTLA